MRMVLIIAATGLIAITGASGLASEPAGPDMRCAAVREIFDATTPDAQKIRDVVNIIMDELSKHDRKNASKGLPQIFARMSAEGKRSTAAAVTVRCEDHPEDSLAQSADSVYKGLYAMGKGLGVNP